ncbi:cytochrome P450, family 81, subfamily D, polypeptide 6 [Prunus dulcis]|uniref:Cytochrome P450, family 81, subfamily D, polypeptide 6 n=1 Tax=Prunus dulcis TaxID=3755 RepID=A0A4Y1QT89_PRUDU|nr:cytochrome P450, family 81, subfamily D, polypeptide 6 [Prunus dulcis]
MTLNYLIAQYPKRIPGTIDYKVECNNNKLSGQLDQIVEKRRKECDREAKDFLPKALLLFYKWSYGRRSKELPRARKVQAREV